MIALNGVHRIPNLGDAINGDIIDVFGVLYAVAHRDIGNRRGKRLRFPLPLPTFTIQLADYVILAHAINTRHPAIRKVKTMKFVKESKNGLLAVGDRSNDTHVLSPKLRLKPSIKRSIIEVLIQQKRCLRIFEWARTIGDHRMKIGKKPIFIKKFRINAQITTHQVELVELLAKRF